jgi:hypothetical protein
MSVVTDNYNPKVSNPNMPVNIPQMRSLAFQPPFYFGGSQVPYNLGMSQTKSMKGGNITNKFNKITPNQTKQTIIIPHTLPFR